MVAKSGSIIEEDLLVAGHECESDRMRDDAASPGRVMLRRANGPTPRFLDPTIVVRPTPPHLLHNFRNNFCKGLTATERPKTHFVERFFERGSAECLSAVQTAILWSSRGCWSSSLEHPKQILGKFLANALHQGTPAGPSKNKNRAFLPCKRVQ